MFILWGILAWLVPIVIVVAIVRGFSHRGHKNPNGPRPATYRDLMLATIGLAGGYAGAVTLYYLPLAMFGTHNDNAAFTTRFVLGVMLLVAGLLIKRVAGVFLMIMGLSGFILAAPFVFDNLGSAGALLVVLLAFAILVVFAVKTSRKTEHHG